MVALGVALHYHTMNQQHVNYAHNCCLISTTDIGGTAASQAWGDLRCLYEPLSPLILDGPCMLLVYWGGTVATTGFAQIEWLEYPTSYFK